MKKLFIILSAISLSFSALAQTSKASIIELSVHRIDRLVTLKKIDATFLTNLEKVELSLVLNQPPYFYRSIVSQTQPTQGLPIQLEILFDQNGAPLTYKVIPGGTAGADIVWPDKNSATLSENSMHEVLENPTDARIAPFFNGATSFTLSKTTLLGKDVSRGQITSSLTNSKLNVYLNLDGTFISTEVVP